MNQTVLNYDGQRVIVKYLRVGYELWLHLDGQTRVFDQRPMLKSKNAGKMVGGSDLVVSPMPGKILKVNVIKGQVVKSGQVLVVIEAMKMEYSLEAGIDGTAVGLHCNEGQQVDLGEMLVRLEPLKTGEK